VGNLPLNEVNYAVDVGRSRGRKAVRQKIDELGLAHFAKGYREMCVASLTQVDDVTVNLYGVRRVQRITHNRTHSSGYSAGIFKMKADSQVLRITYGNLGVDCYLVRQTLIQG
jgi:ribosome modulation factor